MGEQGECSSQTQKGLKDEQHISVDKTAGMRSLLLRYMLYDSLIRPTEWQFAPAFDAARTAAWDAALQTLAQRQNAAAMTVASLEAPRQIPVVPVLAARALSAQQGLAQPARAVVMAYEPIRPTAAALRSAASDNGVESALRVIPLTASSYKKLKSDSEKAAAILCPGVEEVSSFFDSISEVFAARRLVARPGAQVLPARAHLVAVALHVPSQSAPVRTEIGAVAGFDLRAFNAFRGHAPADSVRLRDIKTTALSKPTPVVVVDLCSGEVTGDLDKALGGNPGASREAADAEGGSCSGAGGGEASGSGSGSDDDEDEGGSWPLRDACWRGSVRCTASGRCTALALWVDCSLGGEGWDLPGGPESRSRRQLVAFLPKELPVAEGDVLEFTLGRCAPSVRLHSCRLAASGGSDHKRGEMGGAEGAGREGSENACMEKWHWPMVLDHRRNSAYDAAVSQAVGGWREAHGGRGPVVLDIGGGSGLLAMMAARAGAASISCIERIPDMAATAEKVIAANGHSGAITVLRTDSTAMTELPGGLKADIVLSEILDDGLLGEGVIPTIAHARRALAAPGATVVRLAPRSRALAAASVRLADPFVPADLVGSKTTYVARTARPQIPARAAVFACLAYVPPQGEPLAPPKGAWTPEQGGRALSLDSFLPSGTRSYGSIRLDRVDHVVMTEVFRALDFRFDAPLEKESSSGEYARQVAVAPRCTASGTANCVLFWFSARLLGDGVAGRAADAPEFDFCTYPALAAACNAAEGTRCWSQAVQFLREPVAVAAGECVELEACHTSNRVYFRIGKGKETSC